MAFSTTITWTSGQTVTASQMNAQVSANMDIANKAFIALGIKGSITSGAKKGRFVVPYAMTINTANASVGTKSTAGSFVVDVLRTTASTAAATTIFSATSVKGITVTSGAFEGTALVPGVTALAAGHVLTLSVTTNSGSAATADASVILSVSGA